MAPNIRASADKGTTIRAASKNKQRSQAPNKSTASPFGATTGGSLASSLSSLFSPQPHGKDAALASLLASSSRPPVQLGAKSGLAAFGSIGSSKPSKQASAPPAAACSSTLDEKRKVRQKDLSSKSKIESPSTSSSMIDATTAPGLSAPSTTKKEPSSSSSKMQSIKEESKAPPVATPSPRPAVPNVPAGRKPVFRPVLSSSTAVSWPEMPVAGSKTILHTLLETLSDAPVQSALNRDLGRRCRAGKEKAAVPSQADAEPSQLAPAQVLAGINSVTRALEADIASDLESMHSPNATDSKQKGKNVAAPPRVKVVFVCRHDLPQPSLIAHLPMIVTARNAVAYAVHGPATIESGVLLFALPSSSEELLAKALGLRRVSILALTSAFSAAHLGHLLSAIERETGSVCLLRASWLETAMLAAKQSGSRSLTLTQQPTTIKLLRTTQPTDLNACKAAKKSRRKERSARWKKRKMQAQQRIRSLRAELKHASRAERKKLTAKLPPKNAGSASEDAVSMDTS